MQSQNSSTPASSSAAGGRGFPDPEIGDGGLRLQDVGAAQINQAMQQLDKVGYQNASASEQVSSTSEELALQPEQRGRLP